MTKRRNGGGVQGYCIMIGESHRAYYIKGATVTSVGSRRQPRAWLQAELSPLLIPSNLPLVRREWWFPHDQAYEQHTEDSHSHWIIGEGFMMGKGITYSRFAANTVIDYES